jgi:uncharacterized protein (DUF1501 family)
MLDPDISTASALHHLHRPVADDIRSLDRRRFLQLVGMGLGAGLVSGPGTSLLDAALPGHDPAAWALGPIGAADGILVVIGMYGGNDGLNTVVPITDGLYYDHHGALAIAPGDAINLNATTGLHPELTELKRFWDAGQLGIVEGVGHAQDEFSHFSSMAKWMAGRPTGLPTSGWVGRWLDGYLGAGKDLFAAAEIGYGLPLHMIGERSVATTVPAEKPGFGVPRDWRAAADLRLFETVRSIGNSSDPATWLGRIGRAQIDQLGVAQALAPVIPDEASLPATEIVAKLEIAARLINANLGFRVLTAGFGDFDSHAGQPDQHPLRMSELNAALQRFFSTLHPAWAGRVTVMTFSEFGRTPYANDGQGTDHGSSAPQFVLGAGVKGGLYGQRPSLAGLQRWDRMPTHVDIRDYYGSVIDGWLGGGGSTVVPGFSQNLGLFSTGPNPDPTFAGGKLGEFVAMAPERIYDTRNGVGGRTIPIGPGETVKIAIAGAGSIPGSDVSAVSVNITSIRPTGNTWLVAYPTGYPQPDSSTLNPRAGAIVPNMSVVGVGADGTISLYNDSAELNVTVDVMGYFRTAAASRMMPLSPHRILDTRTGIGAPQARVSGGQTIALQVLGQGGVPAESVDAVIVNLASIRPTTDGWVTAWPTGVDKPLVANLSYRAGQVVPNLMMCKVGPDGKINIEASSGDVDLLGDVVGCFTSSGSQLSPVAPARLLDTRKGIGAPLARVGAGQSLTVTVTGIAGVPTSATAVALNVSAVRPTVQTFLTIFPGGEAMPTASSLNPDAGAVSANLVIAKVGAGGTVTIYNDQGDVDLLADVTAFFL